MRNYFLLAAAACVAVASFTRCAKRVEDPGFRFLNYTACTPPSGFLGHIVFADEQNGLMARGQNQVYKTTDGGVSWSMTYQTLFRTINHIVYPHKDTCYIFQQEDSWNPYEVKRSVDGGLTWTLAFSLADYAIPSFYNGMNGYAYSAVPPANTLELLRTNDAASTWTSAGTFSNRIIRMQFSTHDRGYAIDSISNFITTQDAGMTWITTRTNVAEVSDMKADGDCYALQTGTGIIKSTDFGVTWSTVLEITDNTAPCHLDHYANHIVVSLGSVLHVSDDGGLTWTRYLFQNFPHEELRITEIIVVDSNHTLAVIQVDNTHSVLYSLSFP